MSLKSRWFSGNERLERCLISHPHHVLLGDQGVHVLLIQQAVMLLDGTVIGSDEVDAMRYGPSTAAAVLAYKRQRNIINPAYQTTADDIVGKMTIAFLDGEMLAREQALFTIAGAAGPLLGGILAAPKIQSTAKAIVVTETNAPWFAWAKNWKKSFGSLGWDFVEIGNQAPIAIVANRLKLAAAMAGPRGLLILSVGHGGLGTGSEDGFFDLGPASRFQVGGRNAILPGMPAPSDQPPHRVHTSAFYDFRTPNPVLAGGFVKSQKDQDEASSTPGAKERLRNFGHYEDVGRAFKNLSSVLLLTCKVVGATGFLARVRQQWGTPIIGYPRQVAGQQVASGRTRIFLQGDAPGTGTNIPFGEFFFPVSKDMVVIR